MGAAIESQEQAATEQLIRRKTMLTVTKRFKVLIFLLTYLLLVYLKLYRFFDITT